MALLSFFNNETLFLFSVKATFRFLNITVNHSPPE